VINEVIIAAEIDWSFLWSYIAFGVAIAVIVEAAWLRLK